MGYGFAGETFHAPVIEHCGRATVAAIATGKPERAQTDYPNARIVEDFDGGEKGVHVYVEDGARGAGHQCIITIRSVVTAWNGGEACRREW